MNLFKKNASVYFVGAGPGDPGLITVRGREIVSQADLVLFAGSLVPREVVACAKDGAMVVDSAPLSLDETHAMILSTVRAGGIAARVHTGDPSLYGTIREQASLLERDGVPFEIIPGVTAAFAAAARAGVSFTVPESTQSLIITRMNGRTPVPAPESLARLAAHGSSLAVYLSADKAHDLVRELRVGGVPETTAVVIGVKVGHPDERIIRTTLAELEETVATQKISRQAVFLILPGESVSQSASRLYAPEFGHGFRASVRPATWPRIAVYALTRQGLSLARQIAAMDASEIFAPARMAEDGEHGFHRISDQVRANFDQYHAHVFVAATGIVVRAIAPVLRDKSTDPAVVVCDQNGEHVISLLSGHLGGANDLSRRLADQLQGRAVITTATDTAGRPAIDSLAQQHGCVIADPARITRINAILAEGGRVSVFDPDDRLGIAMDEALQESFETVAESQAAQVCVTWRTDGHGLTLHPKCLVAGIGCRRGTSREEILQALEHVFVANGLAPASLACLASVDLKIDEAGLEAAAKKLNVSLEFYDRSVLDGVTVPNPSELVREKIGVESVCEASALNAARNMKQRMRLIVPKTIVGRVTVAVALAG